MNKALNCGFKTIRPSARWIGLAGSLLAACLFGHRPLWAQELQLLTEENPPFSMSDHGKATGLGVEVVEALQRRVGNHSSIRIMPWARAFAMAQKEDNVAIFVTGRTPEREALFKWVGPVTEVETGFYALRKTRLTINSMADARAAPAILVPRDYYPVRIMEKDGFNKLMTADSTEQMIRMLQAGRAPLMVISNASLSGLLTKLGLSADTVVLEFPFLRTQSYIAFSSGTSDEIVQAWQHALDDMKRDGSFARLYEKWIPGAKPPGLLPSPPYYAGSTLASVTSVNVSPSPTAAPAATSTLASSPATTSRAPRGN